VVIASRDIPAHTGKSFASMGVPSETARQVSSGMAVFNNNAAAVAPASCAAQYSMASMVLRRLVTQMPIVTAGLKCPPEM